MIIYHKVCEKDMELSDTKIILESGVNEHDNVMDFSPRVKFNVGGKLFECYFVTLKRFPESRLAKLDDKSINFHSDSNEFFFDRNSLAFEAILEACRTGELHMPRDLCNATIQRELEFWGISPSYLSPCCWKTFYR